MGFGLSRPIPFLSPEKKALVIYDDSSRYFLVRPQQGLEITAFPKHVLALQ
jgi:hypothetical protein